MPIGIEPVLGAPRILLEIPTDILRLRRERPELAEQWRAIVRLAFHAAFDAGYRAVDFLRDENSVLRRTFYVLELRENDPVHGASKSV